MFRWTTGLTKFLLMILLLSTTTSAAQARRSSKKKRWTKLVQLAQKQYKNEQYVESAETLLKAYDLRPVAKLLYNSARAHEKAGDDEQAMRFYQRYIDAENTDPELLRNAATKLAALREARVRAELEQKQRVEEEKKKAEAERKRLEAERQRIIDEEKARKIEAARQARLKKEQDKMNMILPISAYSLLGLGTAGLLSGAVFGVLAMQDKAAWDGSLDLATRQSARDSAQFKALGADISFAAGSVLVLAGSGLLALHFLRADDEKIEDKAATDSASPAREVAADDDNDDDEAPPPPPGAQQNDAAPAGAQSGAATQGDAQQAAKNVKPSGAAQ